MPPSAISKRPGRSLMAPVKAPRSWPNSSDSISVSAKMAQLTGTKGWPPVAGLVNQVGDQLLAGAGLAGDEDAAVRVGDHPHVVEHRPHPGAAADDDLVDGKREAPDSRHTTTSSSKPGTSSRSACSRPMKSVIDALGQPTQLPLIRTVALLPETSDELDVAAVALDERPDPRDHDFDLFPGDHTSLYGRTTSPATAPARSRSAARCPPARPPAVEHGLAAAG